MQFKYKLVFYLSLRVILYRVNFDALKHIDVKTVALAYRNQKEVHSRGRLNEISKGFVL